MKLNKIDIENVLMPLSKKHLKQLSRQDLEDLFLGEQNLRIQAYKKLEEKYCVEGRYIILKRRFYNPSTEKSPKNKASIDKNKRKKSTIKKILKPSDRYPNAEIEDIDVVIEGDVSCDDCGSEMIDSGLEDVSEVISIIPKKYIIERYHYKKYKCTDCCFLLTTPRVPRIKPGSSYSDEMIIDVSMSKYCDLIPIERYAAMASREGFMNLPPNTLIELTHYLAHIITPLLEKIKKEILDSKVLRADETPHRMMEQIEKKQWYLWGFSSLTAAYFECHPSRSGDIAANFLKESQCSYLMSDVYSGYKKGVRLANETRKDSKIIEIYCNAHARRKFKEEEDNEISKFFIWCYKKIYRQEKNNPDRIWQDRYFRAMKKKAENIRENYSFKSGLYQAANYFLKNYEGFTLFLTTEGLPIDNNHQERLLRSPVIGRKTWYGTHSLEGGKTSAALFSIVESCKLVKINPRTYLTKMIKKIHKQEEILTPFEAKRDYPEIFFEDPLPQKIN